MSEKWMLSAILLPILAGVLVPMLPWRKRRDYLIWIEAATIVTSVLVVALLLNRPEETLTVFRFTGNLSITLRMDGPGGFYGALVAGLWPFACLYAFEYMKNEEGERSFFMFYMITYGVTLGVAMAENILTLYFFFEMLSLITLPLVMHTRTREAVLASRTYLYYMLGGAAFAFIGVIYLLTYGQTSSFQPGGVLDLSVLGEKADMMLVVFVLCFLGFSVKTAVFPFSGWLPKAGVAPTPVTALLHAVAVVNTGAFAAMRVTYYSFGVEHIRGTWAQYVLLGLVVFTIVYGCSRALKETHVKRRLAWSTVSNLSYILFGIVLMTPLGLAAGLTHMLFHSVMKITAFFCAGAVLTQTKRAYVYELDGLGWKMPFTFLAYLISGLALMGVPGLCGFVSKWYLAKAALVSENPFGYVGVAALLVSALLTAIYMLSVMVRAFCPPKDFDGSGIAGASDPGPAMLLPLGVFVVLMLVFGLCSDPVVSYLTRICAAAL